MKGVWGALHRQGHLGKGLWPFHLHHVCVSCPGPCDFSFFYKFIYLFIYLFLAVLGLCCCTRAFSSCSERGLLFVAVRRLLTVVASLVARALGAQASVVVARGL